MSFLESFEKKVERFINALFSKFDSKDLRPVDLSSALEQEIDKEAVSVGHGCIKAPNEYRFKMSSADINLVVDQWGNEMFADKLADNLTQYAKSQEYTFDGPVVVIFEEDFELSKSKFQLSSDFVPGNVVPVTSQAQSGNSPMLEINGNQYLLTKDTTVIGRSGECDIVIDDAGISRKHLQIEITDQGVIARDLHSTNGTYVEGHQVPAAALLDGNTITIGRTRILYWASLQEQE